MARILAVAGVFLALIGAQSAMRRARPTHPPVPKSDDRGVHDNVLGTAVQHRPHLVDRTDAVGRYRATAVERYGHDQRIADTSRSGFLGSDSFTYARRGFDTRNNPAARIVRVSVTVTP
jgi:hypothetical protein